MSRLYQIDIELEIDKPFKDFTAEDEEFVKTEVCPYLFAPHLDPTDRLDRDQASELSSCWQYFDCFEHFNHCDQTPRTRIRCGDQRNFTGGYSEGAYERDAIDQIEKFKLSLPYRFEATIGAEYLEREPDLVFSAGNLYEEEE